METQFVSSGIPPAISDYIEKIHCLKHLLSRDLLACDAKWTLFVAAALSYRFESQLKPFPPRFLSDMEEFNIEALITTINDTPKLNILLQNINEENYEELNGEVVSLVAWVLGSVHDPYLRSMDSDEYEAVLSKMPQKADIICPNYIFAISPTIDSEFEEIFQRQKIEFPSRFAFYGSTLDSFYSIINHGLQPHLCEKGEFGEGICLSTELSVAMEYSPFGAGWGASNCGGMLSCVALCEYIENPDHFEINADTKHDVPNTFVVIRNNDAVRVRYLLFYGQQLPEEIGNRNVVYEWMSRNRNTLSIVYYTLVLTTIGMVNSGYNVSLRDVISQKVSSALSFIKKLFGSDA